MERIGMSPPPPVKAAAVAIGYSPGILRTLRMDIVYLRDLKVDCVIGIYDWERRIRQTLYIDIDMATDIRKAAASDDIKDTLDYKAVSKRIQQFVGESGFQLVETLAEKLADIILKEFPVPWVRVRINKKGAVRNAGAVGVVIERGAKTRTEEKTGLRTED